MAETDDVAPLLRVAKNRCPRPSNVPRRAIILTVRGFWRTYRLHKRCRETTTFRARSAMATLNRALWAAIHAPQATTAGAQLNTARHVPSTKPPAR